MADWGAYGNGCLGPCRLAGLAFLFSVGILLQILVCFCSDFTFEKQIGSWSNLWLSIEVDAQESFEV
jgi:hypothetical protein